MTTHLTKETDRYLLEFRTTERPEISIRSKTGGKFFAVHTHYNLLDDDGKIIDRLPVTPEVAEFIIRHFEQRGDTESFNIYQSDIAQGRLLPRTQTELSGADVRHRLTSKEKSFTATGAKLAHHWPIFKKYSKTGYGSIIRATMTNHQRCTSRCHYCSTISRNKSDSITLDEAKDFVKCLYFDQAQFNKKNFPEYNALYREATGSDIRLRGLILSGGGQPNLWPHFEPFVDWLGSLDLDLGLITNGFPPKIGEDIYNRFKWVRVSITPEDASPHYPGRRFDRQYFPKTIVNNPRITVGLSYVCGPWTSDDIFLRIKNALDEHGFDYCRLLTDCNLTRNAQLRAHQALAEKLLSLGLIDSAGTPTSKIFHQLKFHGTQEEADQLWDKGQCFLQTYNVFWDTTGHAQAGFSYCYPCDSVTVLAEEAADENISASERKFDSSKWGTAPNTEVHRLFTEPVRPFFDPRSICASCLFVKNNQTAKNLVRLSGKPDALPDDSVDHLNFP